jgi:hypothetical protein
MEATISASPRGRVSGTIVSSIGVGNYCFVGVLLIDAHR